MGMRLLGLLFAIAIGSYCADGVRMKRSDLKGAKSELKKSALKGAKFVAGVPILNYHLSASKASVQEGADEDWILVVKPDVSDAQVHKMCSKLTCMREGHPKQGGVPYFEVRASEAQLGQLLSATGSMVRFVERDEQRSITPDMPGVKASSASWGLDRVGAPLRSTTGNGVHIYVVDTGIRASHTDYGGRASSAIDLSSGSLVECKGAASCALDRAGHGSHCAGSAAGTRYGVAPAATLHSVKTLTDQGGGPWSWDYDALDWMATKGERPAVVSMSLGGGGVLTAYEVAVDSAVAAGLVVVVAGGNSNSNACSFTPAFIASAITVGSTDATDTRSYFSNYGSCTQIWAPGSDITSVGISNDNDVDTMSGTSMACPHVSGGVALMLEENGDLNAAEVLVNLLNDATSDAIKDLKSGDVNKLLYVGARAPQIAPVARSCGNNGPFSTKTGGVNISIVNGEDAAECEFPWQVGLWRPNTVGTRRPFCGGTLIDPEWILTAAHCIDGSSFEIVAGDWKASDISAKQQQRPSGQLYKHPKYNGNTMTHDYALVHVDNAFKVTDCVALACLPYQDVADDSECFTSGWGTLQSGGSQPDILQQTDVQFVSQEQCQTAYSNENIDGTMLCAAGLRNGQPTDACQGDSGGPLVCRSQSNGGVWTLAGATSWGYGCADPSYPGIWAKVHAVVDWVDETMANPPPGPRTKCDNGCVLNPDYNNDGFCDCSECEDEELHTCDSCLNECPERCGEYTKCT